MWRVDKNSNLSCLGLNKKILFKIIKDCTLITEEKKIIKGKIFVLVLKEYSLKPTIKNKRLHLKVNLLMSFFDVASFFEDDAILMILTNFHFFKNDKNTLNHSSSICLVMQLETFILPFFLPFGTYKHYLENYKRKLFLCLPQT